MKTIKPTRIDELLGWLVTHRALHRDLGNHLDVPRSSATRILRSDTVKQEHFDRLRSYVAPTGHRIPANLLPAVSSGRPGPKPKAKAEGEAA